jgi:hypothetical protein
LSTTGHDSDEEGSSLVLARWKKRELFSLLPTRYTAYSWNFATFEGPQMEKMMRQ